MQDIERENKKAVLVVSFGTSYRETSDRTIGAIELAMGDAFPGYDIKRAFTSRMFINKLQKEDGIHVDYVTEAMDGLRAEGYKTVVVQPTHVMGGLEYKKMKDALEPYRNCFLQFAVGAPLLGCREDFEQIAEILVKETEHDRDDSTAVVFVGHGTEHVANSCYQFLEETLRKMGYSRCFVVTVEAFRSLDSVRKDVKAMRIKKVILLPFMIAAGEHVASDMAGEKESSWKSRFQADGYEVQCVLKGLGEYKEIQDLFVCHAKEALKRSGKL